MKSMRELMRQLAEEKQETISREIVAINEKDCMARHWKSDGAHGVKGEGRANYFQGGKFLETGCANVSTLKGPVLGEMARLISIDPQDLSKHSFFATGISLIFHSYSPFVPSIHANYRYCEIVDGSNNVVLWYFGGGADLTPYYLFEEDATHFHRTLKKACDKTDPTLYENLKKAADDYFYLPHRKEHRGIGGIFVLRFFDRPQEEIYHWVQECSDVFLPSYLPIAEKRMNEPFTEEQKKWQLLRRGRYIEFNLLYEKGLSFLLGLNMETSVENVFMAFPQQARWEFGFTPLPHSPEEKLLEVLKNPRDWV